MGREELDFFWVEEYTKGNNGKNVNEWEEDVEEEEDEEHGHMHSGSKRRYTKRVEKMEFCGWGSKPLIEFFQHIGKDTSAPISQYEAASFISKYITDQCLLHPTKKKRVVCDEWLTSLFGKRTISKIKVYDLLGSHFAENVLEFDSDDSSSSSRDERPLSRQLSVVSKKRKMVEESLKKSCFAAIVPENVKLVYLKRSLVQKIVTEQPETFEGKVVGCFVRIKTDPYDYSQKNSHMLVQVTGVHRSLRNDDENAEILLQVSNVVKDVTVSMLSDDNFSKEECEDLHQRVKDGLLQRLTVVALEEKVRSLHEDITKHWLVGELASLQRQIDRANEKGWRRELFEYMERKQLLQTPEEQSKLLREVPKVIAEELVVEKVSADEIEVESTPRDSPDNEPGSNGSLNLTLRGALEVPSCDAAVNESSSNSLSIGTAISVEMRRTADREFLRAQMVRLAKPQKKSVSEPGGPSGSKAPEPAPAVTLEATPLQTNFAAEVGEFVIPAEVASILKDVVIPFPLSSEAAVEDSVQSSLLRRKRKAEASSGAELRASAAEGAALEPKRVQREPEMPPASAEGQRPSGVSPPPELDSKREARRRPEKAPVSVEEGPGGPRRPWIPLHEVLTSDTISERRTAGNYLKGMFTPRDLSELHRQKPNNRFCQEEMVQHLLQALLYLYGDMEATERSEEAQSKLHAIIEHTTARVLQADADRDKAQWRFRDAEAKLKEEKARANDMEAKNKELESRNKDLEEQMALLKRALREKEDEVKDAYKKRSRAKEQARKARAELRRSEDEASSREAALASALAKSEEKYRQEVAVWERRLETVPETVVAKYVKSQRFLDFMASLMSGSFRLGALDYREAVLLQHPGLNVGEADEKVPAALETEASVVMDAPAPKFVVTTEDLDEKVTEDTFAARSPPASGIAAVQVPGLVVDDPTEADEPSILLAIHEDPVELPSSEL